MTLQLREFDNSDADYQACVDIWNANHGETEPEVIQQWIDRDQNLRDTHPVHRIIGEIENRIVCYGQWGEEGWAYEPGKYIWTYKVQPDVDPAQVVPVLYAHIRTLLSENGATKILCQARSDQPYRIAFLEEQGYRLIQRELSSWLDVTRFDPEQFVIQMEQIADSGIQIYSVAQLSELDPDWLSKLHGVVEAARMDVPAESPPTLVAFEVFAKRVTSDPETHGTRFVAVDSSKATSDELGHYVGVTNLRYNVVDPKIAHTGLTGIDRAYRRQGIATVLKVHSITKAKADGVERIDTDNDENNPMLDLNMRLGFQPGPAKLLYKKVTVQSYPPVE